MAREQNTSGRPLPQDFADYRVYLRAMIAHLKHSEPGFSHRRFAQRAGFSTSNFLLLVAEGRRNLSAGSVAKFAKGLGLNAKEREAFAALVALGQAKSDAQRNRAYERLRALRRKAGSQLTQLEHDQYDVYTLWYAIPIRELLFHPEFREDEGWIARRFRPALRPSQVRRALKLLQRTGLAVRDEAGRLVPGAQTLASPPTIGSLAARNYHRALLRKSAESLDGLPLDQRNVTSLTLSLSAEEYESLCREITDFRRHLLGRFALDQNGAKGREVYSIGFQAVPLTRTRRKR